MTVEEFKQCANHCKWVGLFQEVQLVLFCCYLFERQSWICNNNIGLMISIIASGGHECIFFSAISICRWTPWCIQTSFRRICSFMCCMLYSKISNGKFGNPSSRILWEMVKKQNMNGLECCPKTHRRWTRHA